MVLADRRKDRLLRALLLVLGGALSIGVITAFMAGNVVAPAIG